MDTLNYDRPYSVMDSPFCKFVQDGRKFNAKGEAMDGLSTNNDAAAEQAAVAEAEAKKAAAEQAAVAEAEAKKAAAEQAAAEASIAEAAAKKAADAAAAAEETAHDLA